MIKKNDIIEGKISKIENNHGVFYCDNKKISVKNVLLNEVVIVKLTDKFKDGFIGTLLEIRESSVNRNKIQCKVYENCGGCQLLHFDYQKQLELKKQNVAKLTKLKIHNVVGMDNPYEYRNKMILGFKQVGNKIIAGLYEEDSHKIVMTKHCLMHDPVCDKIVNTICKLMTDMKITCFKEDYRKGLMRHVVFRKGFVTNEILVTLVTSSPVFPNRNNFVKALVEKHPEITSIVQNINTRQTSIVLGEDERILYGKGYITDVLCGKKVQISSKSFYQINHEQTEKLYKKAIECLKPTKNDVILDAYCGIGTIGFSFVDQAKEVIGVELNKQAVKDARVNAKLNNVNNIRFINADATKYMMECAANHIKIDAIMMDPPRSGSTPEFIKAIKMVNPSRVVYISCNPETQIRDIKQFEKIGYKTKELYLYDMFPHSLHTESICLLVKNK